MPMLMVSPGNQICASLRRNAFFFQLVEGSRPFFSPGMSMPVSPPMPNCAR
jgi:hypothetical protein